MTAHALAWARIPAGILLIAAGLIAMPLPILPGIPIVLAGVALLGKNHPLARRLWTWVERTRAALIEKTK